MIALAILFLILAIAAYSISQLVNHGKLRWSKVNSEFWGTWSSIRKYKYVVGRIQPAPTTYYYKLFNIPYKERFPGSATFLVLFTDGYHFMQSLSFVMLALSLSLFSGYSFWLFWIGIVGVHATVYRLLSK